jgi:hypothetical protein
LKFQVPETEEVEVDNETLAAIDRGIADAGASRTASIGELRKRAAERTSRFESPKLR